jgi:hypothetical protein
MKSGGFVRVLSFAALFVTGLPAHARASFCKAANGPKHDFQILAGYSPASSTWIGRAEDRKFALAGVTYSYKCWELRSADISYSTGVLPVAVLLQPAMPNLRSFSPRMIPKHAVYGFGVMPLGFTARLGRRVVQPFFEMHGGLIASTEPVPVNAPDATGLNFLFDLGAGLRFKIADKHAISTGYKFLHISNASTTNFNPGVDNNVIFVGFSFLK